MLESFSHIFLYFIIYSFIGWFCETLYCSIPAKSFVKRGFLNGPYCPIYGIGAFLILLVGQRLSGNPILVFLVSVAAATLLEYFTGWLLEKLFQIRWWDYTDKKFQLNGRIRLKNSLLFGLLGLVVTYLVHPRIEALIAYIPQTSLRILSNLLTALFLLDLVATVARLTGFTQKLQELQGDIQKLRAYQAQEGWPGTYDLKGSLQRLKDLELPELENSPWVQRLESVLEKGKINIRQLRSYRNARSNHLSEAWDAIREEYGQKKEKKLSSVWTGTKHLGTKTATVGRETAKTIWGNLDYYQLFWVFLLAGVLGYLVETLYCLVTTGTIESRQGLLYGPFNQVYGFGAVLMVLVLTPLAKKNDRWVFLGSAVLGGAFEILCSWIQESVFGSVSWQYSEDRFSMAGGRTSLLFMFFWGILGLFFIKGLYPRLLSFIHRIPRKQGRILTGILSLVLVWNMSISALAVMRWSQRIDGSADENAIGTYLDERYPNSFMENIYPNMHWPGEKKYQLNQQKAVLGYNSKAAFSHISLFYQALHSSNYRASFPIFSKDLINLLDLLNLLLIDGV